MAAGLPVVTRPVGGIKDFFADGEMGFLTQETTPEAFAEYMERLLSDWRLREAISKHNASYAREHFTAGSAARRLGDIYRNVLDN
jgi:glycosyltransferase involved in cell wall biosynthesis